MNPQYHNPESLTGAQLDILLSSGWYRMGRTIFTTDYIIHDNSEYRVFWLRYNINKLQLHKKQEKLLQNNGHFTISIGKIEITEELETLYTLYKTSLSFTPSSSVKQWLYGEDEEISVYNTLSITIRNNDKLIGVGIFDKGETSIAGIMNFYHPDYKKYSLGKYLILLKIKYAQMNGKQWYYPGYIVFGYSSFDYKLFVGEENIEVYIGNSAD